MEDDSYEKPLFQCVCDVTMFNDMEKGELMAKNSP